MSESREASVLAIGLTGNIGSGKSTVAGIWSRERGAMVIDADELGREAVRPGGETLRRLEERFGPEVIRDDGTLDRRRMAVLAFSDESNLRSLNEIVHPVIITGIMGRMERAREDGARAVVVDAALIFEFGFHRFVDTVVMVDAPREAKITRMLEKGKMDRETVEKVLETQLDPAEMRKLADHVIENDGDMERLHRKAIEIFDKIV